jgi:hypothetical protein
MSQVLNAIRLRPRQAEKLYWPPDAIIVGAHELVRNERGIAQDREEPFQSDPCPRE